jgi:hypothetical protein
MISRDAKILYKKINLFLTADRGIDLSTNHAGQLDCSQTHAATAAMDENRLQEKSALPYS